MTNEEDTKVVPSTNLARDAVAEFLASHPAIECTPTDANTVILFNPWEEEGFALRITDADNAAIAALNGVILPKKFTAIWHKQTKDLEIIWAPIALSMDEASRSFAFHFEGVIYRCEFGAASNELRTIAGCAVLIAAKPLGENSRFHNLLAIHNVERSSREDYPEPFQSTSFWIRNVEWNEDELVEVARYLNFHMYYFDRRTPQIVIHDLSASAVAKPPMRYPFATFPPTIIGRPIEPFLLGLWASSTEGDVRLRFLYLYQILEYAAFYWMRDTTQQAIRRVLSSPETYMPPNAAVKQIMDVLVTERSTDEQKLVEPEPVWNEIAANLPFFSKEIRFEGGITLSAPVSATCTSADFCNDWRKGHKFTQTLKDIRNALVHGREARMSNVIEPTVANDANIRQFLPPLTSIAMRVALAIDM